MKSVAIYPDVLFAKEALYDGCNYAFSSFLPELEGRHYSACTFQLGENKIKFRSAKITPAKTGLFVTLWKRDEYGTTCPHDHMDAIDFFVISVRKDKLAGHFIFPKHILLQQGILSTPVKEGKRGFRVYPPWDETEKGQAQKTQRWQSDFFVEIKNELAAERVRSLFSK